jgi:hypothetical protein
MSATEISVPIRHSARVPFAVRGAQALFFIPLGLLQLVAAIVFGITDGVRGGEYAIGAWAATMAATGILVALRLSRGGTGIRRLALALLAAQTVFSVVKLTVYHESASFVFFAVIATAAALLSASRGTAGRDA